jgi:hypothetical protein
LGGTQTYRLSSCDQSICTVDDTISYELDLNTLTSAIPQNVQIAQAPPPPPPPTPAANLVKSGTLLSAGQDDNPYAFGKGFSEFTGHGNPSYTSAPKGTANINSAVSVEDYNNNVEITWTSVTDATHYVMSKVIDRNGLPSYGSEYTTQNSRYYAAENTFNMQLREGKHIIVIHACMAASEGASGYCGSPSTSEEYEVVVEYDIPRQPQNYTVPARASAGAPFSISWTAPTDTVGLNGYKVYGELRGALHDGDTGQLSLELNNPNIRPLAPGRQYCYKVKSKYDTGSGEYTVGQCITIGESKTPILPAPAYLTIVNNSEHPDEEYYLGYLLSWGNVEGADYYQLDRDLGNGVWAPVYMDTRSEARIYFSDPATDGVHFRVSACKADGQCGNYQRLLFSAEHETVAAGYDQKPACLYVPETAQIGAAIPVTWCAPHQSGVTRYDLLDANGQVLVAGLPGDSSGINLSLQGLNQWDHAGNTAGAE